MAGVWGYARRDTRHPRGTNRAGRGGMTALNVQPDTRSPIRSHTHEAPETASFTHCDGYGGDGRLLARRRERR
jgi:hypothetical protein